MTGLRRFTEVVQWVVGVAAATAVVMLFTLDNTSPAPATEPAPTDDPIVLGARLYTANCAGCHGVAGEGTSGPRLADVVVDAYPDPAAVAALINDGRGTMPAFADRLDPEEIMLIVEFVRDRFA